MESVSGMGLIKAPDLGVRKYFCSCGFYFFTVFSPMISAHLLSSIMGRVYNFLTLTIYRNVNRFYFKLQILYCLYALQQVYVMPRSRGPPKTTTKSALICKSKKLFLKRKLQLFHLLRVQSAQPSLGRDLPKRLR